VLTSEPRLKYFKEEELRGEVPLGRGTQIKKAGNGRFDVITPKRTYQIRGVDKSSNTDLWISEIQKLLKEKFP